MNTFQKHFLPFAILFALLICAEATPCSGYKITVGNRTFFGSNEDAWRLTPHIWFETAKKDQTYGAAFTGSRWEGVNGFAPQAGMNEAGVVFERLASHWPGESVAVHGKQKINNPTAYLKEILHRCGSLEEVRAFIAQYDHSYFMEDVFVYADRSGRYLVVEPYSTTIGTDAAYVFANFCPSVTASKDALKMDRYRNGKAFVAKGHEATLEYARALSDTMHVCREKRGDGTLLSSIWDLQQGVVNLYFYHQYQHTLRFDIAAELRKGDHLISLKELFPENEDFNKLRDFKTPLDSVPLAMLVVGSGGFFLCSAVVFPVAFYRRKRAVKYRWMHPLLGILALLLCFFLFVIIRFQGIYYFTAPYQVPGEPIISASAYMPYVMLLLVVPLLILNYSILKQQSWGMFLRTWFTIHNLLYLALLTAFCYWGFYQ